MVAKMDGVKLQSKNNKLYRYVAQAQVLVLAAIHLILGMYFAFSSTEYINHTATFGEIGFAAKTSFVARIEAHRNLDQICAVVCFALVVLWLRLFIGLRKDKKISVVYYIGMVVSAVLPFVYMLMSDKYIVNTMAEVLAANYPEVIVDGVGNANWIVFWSGVEYGAWPNGAEITHESQLIVDCLGKIGVEAGAQVDMATFDLGGVLTQFRNEMYSWNKFELYAIVNVAVSAVLVVFTAIFVPLKKKAAK